ncbi:hypothetical protein M6B24_24510, partial [Enterobacter bugandensis]|nr:hypothetical protein [Enterobacter bugandensis]
MGDLLNGWRQRRIKLAQWVPTLAGIWLPVGTRIAFEESPKLTRHALVIPDLRYLVE